MPSKRNLDAPQQSSKGPFPSNGCRTIFVSQVLRGASDNLRAATMPVTDRSVAHRRSGHPSPRLPRTRALRGNHVPPYVVARMPFEENGEIPATSRRLVGLAAIARDASNRFRSPEPAANSQREQISLRTPSRVLTTTTRRGYV